MVLGTVTAVLRVQPEICVVALVFVLCQPEGVPLLGSFSMGNRARVRFPYARVSGKCKEGCRMCLSESLYLESSNRHAFPEVFAEAKHGVGALPRPVDTENVVLVSCLRAGNCPFHQES